MDLFCSCSITILAVIVLAGQVTAKRSLEQPDALVSPSEVGKAIEDAFAVADREIKKENEVFLQGRRRSSTVDGDIAGSRHDKMQVCSEKARHMEQTQHRYEKAAQHLISSYNLSAADVEGIEPRFRSASGGDKCGGAVLESRCEFASRFRTMDGSCNNLRHPSWGMAPACYTRMLHAAYDDGLSSRRTRAKSGRPLPLARTLSLRLHPDLDRPNENVTAMLMMWGQFMGHDTTLTPVSMGPDGQRLQCCPLVPGKSHPQCDPIIIPKDDPFFSKLGITCIHNVRSAACGTCTLGVRQQTNQETAFVDASHLYGPSLNISNNLRNLDGTGTFKFRRTAAGGELLSPSSDPQGDLCSFQEEKLDCFQSGDPRVNSHPALTAMHTLFHREHNRLARALVRLNPHWDEERLFQEARRIVIAQVQQITYTEYLPILIGPEYIAHYDLTTTSGRTTYDPDLRPDIVSEFSSAAFRVGHSMIPAFFFLSMRKEGEDKTEDPSDDGFWLRDQFFFPFGLHNGMLEGLIAGLFKSLPENVDNNVVGDVTNHLYKTRGSESGLDLAALNIQRGRDHGVPPYAALLRHCTGRTVHAWADLEGLFLPGLVDKFKGVYESVADIDLFSGGLAEKHLPGAMVGETFACILGTQFRALKLGDRFYYEHRGQAGSLTDAQLGEIRRSQLSHLICRNTDIQEVTRLVIRPIRDDNPLLSCKDFPEMDLSPWIEFSEPPEY